MYMTGSYGSLCGSLPALSMFMLVTTDKIVNTWQVFHNNSVDFKSLHLTILFVTRASLHVLFSIT